MLGCWWKTQSWQQVLEALFMHSLLGAADLDWLFSFPQALLVVHFFFGGIIQITSLMSQKPKILLPYLYSLSTLYRPSQFSFIFQMFTTDLTFLLDYEFLATRNHFLFISPVKTDFLCFHKTQCGPLTPKYAWSQTHSSIITILKATISAKCLCSRFLHGLDLF